MHEANENPILGVNETEAIVRITVLNASDNKECFRSVERLSQPLVALFFILIGFKMDLAVVITPILI